MAKRVVKYRVQDEILEKAKRLCQNNFADECPEWEEVRKLIERQLPEYVSKELPDDLPFGSEVIVQGKDGKRRILKKVGELKGKLPIEISRKSVWYSYDTVMIDIEKHGQNIKDFYSLVAYIVADTNLEWRKEPRSRNSFYVFVQSEVVKKFLQSRLHSRKGWIKLTLGGFGNDEYIYVKHISYRRKPR